ncbi:hypothetical protein HELRODRAFT_172059 [Helobdella robusta]|uniref:Uncharacterized protein n=1 Tax=Helobdella robusta TaxID=6412 RepID=T1F4Z5_HELRO|nr:hypothetical protein HELRODRAFT_172059 [Helobdella robusta]ESO05046.1 hypothetical protein HELRODRAFT_172059 [Helobdella robusta]
MNITKHANDHHHVKHITALKDINSTALVLSDDVTKISETEPWPKSRVKHAVCECDGFLYLFGGRNLNVPLKDSWRYCLKTEKWEELNLIGSRLPHLEGHTATVDNSIIYLFGGSFCNNVIWKIDTKSMRCAPLYPDGQNNNSSAIPKNRKDHTACVYKNHLFIFGGSIDLLGPTNELWSFDLAHPCNDESTSWQLLFPVRLGNNCSNNNSNSYQSQIYQPREMSLKNDTSADFKPQNNITNNSNYRKEHIPKHGPQPRIRHSCVVIDSSMWIYAGECNESVYSDFWKWNFEDCMWSSISIGGKCPLIHKQFSTAPYHNTNSGLLFLNYSTNSNASNSFSSSLGSSTSSSNSNSNEDDDLKLEIFLLDLHNLTWSKPIYTHTLSQQSHSNAFPTDFLIFITTTAPQTCKFLSISEIELSSLHCQRLSSCLVNSSNFSHGFYNPSFQSHSALDINNDINTQITQSMHIEAVEALKRKIFKRFHRNSREDLVSGSKVNIEMSYLGGDGGRKKVAKHSENKKLLQTATSQTTIITIDNINSSLSNSGAGSVVDNSRAVEYFDENKRGISERLVEWRNKKISKNTNTGSNLNGNNSSNNNKFNNSTSCDLIVDLYMIGGRFKGQVASSPMLFKSISLDINY